MIVRTAINSSRLSPQGQAQYPLELGVRQVRNVAVDNYSGYWLRVGNDLYVQPYTLGWSANIDTSSAGSLTLSKNTPSTVVVQPVDGGSTEAQIIVTISDEIGVAAVGQDAQSLLAPSASFGLLVNVSDRLLRVLGIVNDMPKWILSGAGVLIMNGVAQLMTMGVSPNHGAAVIQYTVPSSNGASLWLGTNTVAIGAGLELPPGSYGSFVQATETYSGGAVALGTYIIGNVGDSITLAQFNQSLP